MRRVQSLTKPPNRPAFPLDWPFFYHLPGTLLAGQSGLSASMSREQVFYGVLALNLTRACHGSERRGQPSAAVGSLRPQWARVSRLMIGGGPETSGSLRVNGGQVAIGAWSALVDFRPCGIVYFGQNGPLAAERHNCSPNPCKWIGASCRQRRRPGRWEARSRRLCRAARSGSRREICIETTPNRLAALSKGPDRVPRSQ